MTAWLQSLKWKKKSIQRKQKWWNYVSHPIVVDTKNSTNIYRTKHQDSMKFLWRFFFYQKKIEEREKKTTNAHIKRMNQGKEWRKKKYGTMYRMILMTKLFRVSLYVWVEFVLPPQSRTIICWFVHFRPPQQPQMIRCRCIKNTSNENKKKKNRKEKKNCKSRQLLEGMKRSEAISSKSNQYAWKT